MIFGSNIRYFNELEIKGGNTDDEDDYTKEEFDDGSDDYTQDEFDYTDEEDDEEANDLEDFTQEEFDDSDDETADTEEIMGSRMGMGSRKPFR